MVSHIHMNYSVFLSKILNLLTKQVKTSRTNTQRQPSVAPSEDIIFAILHSAKKNIRVRAGTRDSDKQKCFSLSGEND